MTDILFVHRRDADAPRRPDGGDGVTLDVVAGDELSRMREQVARAVRIARLRARAEGRPTVSLAEVDRVLGEPDGLAGWFGLELDDLLPALEEEEGVRG